MRLIDADALKQNMLITTAGTGYQSMVLAEIDNAPTVDAVWVSCEEEMPTDSQEVVVSVYWTDYGDTILAYGHYNARFDNWKLYSDLEGELIKGYEVVAWMPLPTPYGERSE